MHRFRPRVRSPEVREGRVVLCLGAGATLGATHPDNARPPVGQDLARRIADKFLGPEYRERTLQQVAELSISETDLFRVQSFIAELFLPFGPAEFHRLIPRFVWRYIATTNYDLVLERAYDQVPGRLQQLVVFKKNGERIEDKVRTSDSVMLLKLHGCITEIDNPAIPLILTPDQYATVRIGRSRLFERLTDAAFELPLLFVGQSLADTDIRTLLLEVSQVPEARPRSYVVTPEMTPAEVRFWESKKVTHIPLTFEAFLRDLDSAIPTGFRRLATITDKKEHPAQKRLGSALGTTPSESLMTFLTRDVEYVEKGMSAPDADPSAFYRGYFVDWSPLLTGLDVRRSMTDGILSEVILPSEEERRELVDFFLVKGHAGSGKSVLLRRLAWDASALFDKFCLFLRPSAHPDVEPLAELYRLLQERIFLFVDPISDSMDTVEEFLQRARRDKIPLTIIGGERSNEWNSNCERLEPYLNGEYEVRYLSEAEIVALIDLLTKHKSLGYLAGLPPEEQKQALQYRAGRQLLVALHEATLGKPFSDIVYDEYKSIASPRAQSLYLTVCVFHGLGVPVRAGLISRVHGISFTVFKEELFHPLESVVFAAMNHVIQDYEYRTRHSHIAELVFERVLSTPQERFDEYVRLISAIDPDYAADRQAFGRLTNARELLRLFPDPQMVRQIYATANRRVGPTPFLLQQEAVFEMKSPGGSFDRAGALLEKAHGEAPFSRPIAHSLSELALKRAEGATSSLERARYRDEARATAAELALKDPISAYPHHTLIKASLGELSELLATADQGTVERKVRETDRLIAIASQRFPDDSYIRDAEAQFCSMLDRDERAIAALNRAFSVNKRNSYIASRLARLYEARGQRGRAIDILKESLEEDPSAKNTNFHLALLLKDTPGSSPAEIIHFLRRSFTSGDTNYASQFWFARYLYVDGQREEASQVFRVLANANVDTSTSKEPRGHIQENGSLKWFTGSVLRVETSYAFVVRDAYGDKLFTHKRYNPDDVWNLLKSQARVSFHVAFNYRGPVAVNVRMGEHVA